MFVNEVQWLLREYDTLVTDTTLDDVGAVIAGNGPQKVGTNIDVRHCSRGCRWGCEVCDGVMGF